MLLFDIETFTDKKDGYTLKKLSVVEYSYDSRAELIVTRLYDTKTKKFYEAWGDDIEPILAKLMPDTMVAHNAQFDLLFLKAQYPHLPWGKCKFLCTRVMAQQLYHSPNKKPILSLDNLGKKLLGQVKAVADLTLFFDGLTRAEIYGNDEQRNLMQVYLTQDLDILIDLYKILRPQVTDRLCYVNHWALYQFVNPKVIIHRPTVRKLRAQVVAKRTKLLEKLKAQHGCDVVTEEVLKSRPKFTELVENVWGTIPTKPSPSNPQNQIPQLAKTDDFILEHAEEKSMIGDLVRGRLAYASNLELTRCDTWLTHTKLSPYYHYSVTPSGTFTHRLTGNSAGGANPLNLPRKSLLRKALRPIKGAKFIGFDFTGLELRIARYVARDEPAIKLIESGEDLYIDLACTIMGRDKEEFIAVYKAGDEEADSTRFVFKQVALAAQYGTSGKKLYKMLRQHGVTTVSPQQCMDIIRKFRGRAHPALPQAWRFMEDNIMKFARKSLKGYPVPTTEDIQKVLNLPGDLVLGGGWRWPSGTILRFPDLHYNCSKQGYAYRPAAPVDMGQKDIYGAAFFQSHIQSLANEVISDVRIRLHKAGHYVAMECYDELTPVVRATDCTEDRLQEIQGIAESPLEWWPDAPPLDVEIKMGDDYHAMK